jgi:outer membrane immunogenic protein
MRIIITASLALFAFVGAALAADAEPVVNPGPFSPPPAYPANRTHQEPVVTPGPFDPPPAYPYVKAYNWTGFYVGITGGGALAKTYWSSVPDLTSGSSNLSSGLVGGTIGYNLQAGDPFVVGIEADVDWTGMKTTVSPASCAPGCELKVPWLDTARLRFGYAFNGVLPYVTAGAALGRLQASIVSAPLGTEEANNIGWTVGGGVEFAITAALRAKAEYLYFDLDGFNCNAGCGGGPIAFNVRGSVVRAGLNYRLWGD